MAYNIAPNQSNRVLSIDALRGFIIFTMIFVNDLAIIRGEVVPNWMVHFSDRMKGSGMTFVDLVFPAFIFIIGMSIPFSIRAQEQQGKHLIQIIGHILTRTLSLLLLGIMMVNGWPSTELMGWSAPLWQTLMGICAICFLCEYSNGTQKRILLTNILHIIGFAGLIILAALFVGKQGNAILTLFPFRIYPRWWGILGLLGWAYFISSILYLCFHNHRTALLGCMTLLMSLFPAVKSGVLHNMWLINIDNTLGTQPAIAISGILLSTILMTPNTTTPTQRIRFTLLYIAAMMMGAYLLQGLYGISKNQATPSWALWSCAIIASFWLLFYILCDVFSRNNLIRPLITAGNNVLLAYFLSAIYFSFLILVGLGDWYRYFGETDLAHAVFRAMMISFAILYLTTRLNKWGFRVKL